MTIWGSTIHGITVEQLGRQGRKAPAVYSLDRTCQICGCKLSRYNPGTVCAPCTSREDIAAQAERDRSWVGNLYSEIPEACEPGLLRIIVTRYFGTMKAANLRLGWSKNLIATYACDRKPHQMPEWRREALNKLISEVIAEEGGR